MNWLRRFLYGRNGPDQLSFATLIAGLVLLISAQFIPFPPVQLLLQLLYYVTVFLFFFRILSHNIYKRQGENTRYLALTRPVREWGRLHLRMLREMRTHRYLRCPACRQRLRVPRGKGKIRISCQKCGEHFERKV